MTTIMIEISDEQARQLAEEASQESVSVQELVLQRSLAPWQTKDDKPDFRRLGREIIAENAELYRRLA